MKVSLMLTWLASCVLMSVGSAAVRAPFTSRLLPGPEATMASPVAVDGSIAVITHGSESLATSSVGRAVVAVYDKSLGASWPLRTVLKPTLRPDESDFGAQIALDGNTIAVGARFAVYLFQKDQGGANNWGQVKVLIRTNEGIGLALDGDALAVQAVPLTSGTVEIYRRNLGGVNAWGLESTVPDPNPPDDGGFVIKAEPASSFGAHLRLSGDIFATTGQSGFLANSINLFRRGEAGGTSWGLYRSFDTSKVVGGAVALSTEYDWSDGRLCVNSLKLSGSTYQSWVHLVSPPATATGVWPQSHAVNLTSTSEVPLSFGFQLRCGADWMMIGRLTPNSSDTAYVNREVTTYRQTGGTWALERTTSLGGYGLAPGVIPAAFAPPGYDSTVLNWMSLRGLFGSSLDFDDIDSDGSSLVYRQLRVPVSSYLPPTTVALRERGTSSTWPQTATFAAFAPNAGDFGRSLSIGGNMMAVGDPDDSEGNAESGSVSIYVRRSALSHDWEPFGHIKSPDLLANASFGRAVATNGTLLAVGAPNENSSRGAVYLFSRGETTPDTGYYTWRFRAVIRRPSDQTNTQFGASLALNGNSLAIGAPGWKSSSSAAATGRVFVYNTTAADFSAWTMETSLVGSDSIDNSQLGASVAFEGDTIAAGAWLQSGGGAVYMFRKSSTTWIQVKKVVPSDTSRGLVGFSLALSGDTLALGTIPPIFIPNTGGVFVFERNIGGSNQWGEVRKLIPASDQSGWGGNVALDGDTLLIGSSVHTVGASRSGAAFLHRRHEGGTNAWGQAAQLFPTDSAADDNFGSMMAIDGGSIAIAASGHDGAAADAGAIYTYRFGSYEIWASGRSFAAGTDDTSDDPDLDGLDNLTEFILGSNPRDANSRRDIDFRLTAVGADRFAEAVWTKPSYSVQGVQIDIRGGNNLNFGDYLRVNTDTTAQTIFRTLSPVTSRSAYFLRMEITYPDVTP